MAFATAVGLSDQFETVIVAPEGPVHEEALRLGLKTVAYSSRRGYIAAVWPFYQANQKIAAIGTRVLHTMTAEVLSRIFGCKCANLQLVPGGAKRWLREGWKCHLNHLKVRQVAPSNCLSARLVEHGVIEQAVTVIEHFLTPERMESAVRRDSYQQDGVRKVMIYLRMDRFDEVELLLKALDSDPALRTLDFEIYGTGSAVQLLKVRAMRHGNVRFMGVWMDMAERISHADLFLHLSGDDPFGLAVLDAMAAGVAVLAPQTQVGAIVEEGATGFLFQADDALDLARALREVQNTSAAELQRISDERIRSLQTRFSAEASIAGYRELLNASLEGPGQPLVSWLRAAYGRMPLRFSKQEAN